MRWFSGEKGDREKVPVPAKELVRCKGEGRDQRLGGGKRGLLQRRPPGA